MQMLIACELTRNEIGPKTLPWSTLASTRREDLIDSNVLTMGGGNRKARYDGGLLCLEANLASRAGCNCQMPVMCPGRCPWPLVSDLGPPAIAEVIIQQHVLSWVTRPDSKLVRDPVMWKEESRWQQWWIPWLLIIYWKKACCSVVEDLFCTLGDGSDSSD